MRLGEVNASAFQRSNSFAQPNEPEAAIPAASESRALVALAPQADVPDAQSGYRNVAFLAQLIATKDQHPQTRERRRAEPTVALAAYWATDALDRI